MARRMVTIQRDIMDTLIRINRLSIKLAEQQALLVALTRESDSMLTTAERVIREIATNS